MTKSKRLESDLKSLEQKREQLQVAVESAESEHRDAQNALVREFTSANRDRAASCFAAYSSLKQAAEALDVELADKRAALEQAVKFESEAGERARIQQLEEQMESSLTAYRQLRLQAKEYLEQILPQAAEQWQLFYAAKKELKITSRIHALDQIEYLGPFQAIDQIMGLLVTISQQPTREERKAASRAENQRDREKQEERRRQERELLKRRREAATKGAPVWTPPQEAA
jgi:hypothetical protein